MFFSCLCCLLLDRGSVFKVRQATHFTDLFEDTLGAFQVSPNVVLCGDFNAHVGELK